MTRKKPTLSPSTQHGRRATVPAKSDEARGNLAPGRQQTKPVPKPVVVDEAEIASMDSFPCSDPPGYNTAHS